MQLKAKTYTKTYNVCVCKEVDEDAEEPMTA